MKTLYLAKTLLIAGAALALTHTSKASFAGYTDYSLDGTTAGWDLFYGGNYLPAFTFATGTAGNPISNAGANLDLAAVNPGYVPGSFSTWATGPTGSNNSIPGDREQFYAFFAPIVNFSITSTVAGGDTLTTFVLQTKFSPGGPTGFLNVELNDLAFTASGVSGGVNYWTWTGLNLSAGSSVLLTFDSPGAHMAFDSVQVQTDAPLTAVPEPHEYAITMAALLGTLIIIRRRQARARA